MLRDENGMLTGYVYVDVAGRDIGSYVDRSEARDRASRSRCRPAIRCRGAASTRRWSASRERLKVVLPITLFLVLMLLYLNTRSLAKTFIIMLAVPFSAVGAIWLLYVLGYNMSIGVWVGLIALMGVDAETGVFMLLYLDIAYEDARREGRLRSAARPARRHHARRREADSAEVHDRGDDVHGAGAHHVVRRRRRRRDEAHRRADDRRHLHVVRAGARRLSRRSTRSGNGISA